MPASIIVVDYGMGNVGSVVNMLKKAGHAGSVSASHTAIDNASHVILPGVGGFEHGMRKLHETGIIPILESRVAAGNIQLLGICLGMQLLCEGSEEGQEPGLGLLRGRIVRFDRFRLAATQKVPHMGWNTVATPARTSAVATSADFPAAPWLEAGARYYFVHGYHAVANDSADVWGETEYGYTFASAVRRGNVMGVQFHPEKSHRFGLELLRRFAASSL